MFEDFAKSEHTLANMKQDFVGWHKGRVRYFFWAVKVDQQQWVEAFRDTGNYLQDYLLSNYQRQPHITILPAGFDKPKNLNETKLHQICQKHAAFELDLTGLASFTSCPVLKVRDRNNCLRKLRYDLKCIMYDRSCSGQKYKYRPHMTIGLYDDVYPTSQLTRLIQRHRLSPVPSIMVEKFVLASYQSADICGPINIVEEFSLQPANCTA